MATNDRSPEPLLIHLVEDDASSATATSRVLRAAGLPVRVYGAASDFLAQLPTGHGCIVLDVGLPDVTGLELQEQLARRDDALPVVFLTGQGDVPKTARAMKAGAIDVLTKPVDPTVLLDAVARALAYDLVSRAVRGRHEAARARYGRLTAREREIVAHVISGQLNKQIAFDLGISEHTVKVHRQRVMEKLNVASVPDLVRLALELGIAPVGGV